MKCSALKCSEVQCGYKRLIILYLIIYALCHKLELVALLGVYPVSVNHVQLSAKPFFLTKVLAMLKVL